MERAYPPLSLNDNWPFKKYRDQRLKVREVIELDPKYVRWCMDNADLELDNQAFELYIRMGDE